MLVALAVIIWAQPARTFSPGFFFLRQGEVSFQKVPAPLSLFDVPAGHRWARPRSHVLSQFFRASLIACEELLPAAQHDPDPSNLPLIRSLSPVTLFRATHPAKRNDVLFFFS